MQQLQRFKGFDFMVKVKVTFGKVAIGVLANKERDIKEEETVIYRKGDIFDCPEDRLKDISGSNQIEILEPTQSLKNAKDYGSTNSNPIEKIEKTQPAVIPTVKK